MRSHQDTISSIHGRWFDVLIYPDGSREYGQHGEFDWGKNQIQNSFLHLLLGWAIQWPAAVSYGINVLGLGHGDPLWDLGPATLDHDALTLYDEFYRKELEEGVDTYFIDPATDLPSAFTTNKIEMFTLIGSAEANGELREFALFGGNADPGILDTGYMVNWIRHGVIMKTVDIQIERKIRILMESF